MMKLIKSMALTVIALSSTAAFADDGSDFATPAADKMRLAQELRFQEQSRSQNERFVNADEQAKPEQSTKSEG